MTLQEIAKLHYSGYVAQISDNLLDSHAKTTISFCDKMLTGVRVNNMIVSDLKSVMDSGKQNDYYICTKDRKPFNGTPEEYRIALGYK